VAGGPPVDGANLPPSHRRRGAAIGLEKTRIRDLPPVTNLGFSLLRPVARRRACLRQQPCPPAAVSRSSVPSLLQWLGGSPADDAGESLRMVLPQHPDAGGGIHFRRRRVDSERPEKDSRCDRSSFRSPNPDGTAQTSRRLGRGPLLQFVVALDADRRAAGCNGPSGGG